MSLNRKDLVKKMRDEQKGIRKSQDPLKTLKRLFSYMVKQYKFRLVLVMILILLSTFANVRGSLFLQVVIDDYITPLMGQSNPNFSGLLKAITTMALIYGVGIISNLGFNLIMVRISEGIPKNDSR